MTLPDGLARSAYAERSLGAFWDVYFPAAKGLHTNRFGSTLQTLYVQDEALRIATMALSSASMGRERGDRAFTEQGRKLYGRGLREMTSAIRNPSRATSDALLAVPRVMGLFEILFGADMNLTLQARSWRSHAEGELAIFKARGPEGHVEGAGHQLFIDGRINPVCILRYQVLMSADRIDHRCCQNAETDHLEHRGVEDHSMDLGS